MNTRPPTRRPIDYLLLCAKGMVMGAADIVPGVSGGTMAFIMGIYDELILALHNIRPVPLWFLWRRQGIKAVWQSIHGAFLCTVFLGILTSAVVLSGAIRYAMMAHPLLLWSFFFGLIAASCMILLRRLQRTRSTVLFFVFGVFFIWQLDCLSPTQLPPSPMILFGSGMLAICAMILPGISGAFILLLLGMYETALRAIAQWHLLDIACLAGGACCGLLLFSRLLYWLLHTHRNSMVSLLAGFVAGSLYTLWPWRDLKKASLGHPTMNTAWPMAHTLLSFAFVLFGFLCVFLMERKNHHTIR